MTRDATRLDACRHGRDSAGLEAEILAALWEEVPFPRLPFDAPAELRDLVIDIENPKRVYAIHRASRRHNLQLLIEKFIHQLRYGCGYSDCPTPSCFSCRKRLAGKALIRRYSPTSARTLAVYLAGQDNPEASLCPHLSTPNAPSDAIKPLIFGHKPGPASSGRPDGSSAKPAKGQSRRSNDEGEAARLRPRLSSPRPHAHPAPRNRSDTPLSDDPPRAGSASPSAPTIQVVISERPVRKDYRSFAANVFGTAAFKMIEWLTPQSLETISDSAARVSRKSPSLGSGTDTPSLSGTDDGLFVPSGSTSVDLEETMEKAVPSQAHQNAEKGAVDGGSKGLDLGTEPHASHELQATPINVTGMPPNRPSHSRKTSAPKLRKTSAKTTHLKLSPEQFAEAHSEPALPALKSPRACVPQGDQRVNGHANGHTHGHIRPIPSMSSRSSDDQLGNMVEGYQEVLPKADLNRMNEEALSKGAHGSASLNPRKTAPSPRVLAGSDEHDDAALSTDAELDASLPQSLERLDILTVNFLCDVLERDGTSEDHLLEPAVIAAPLQRSPKNAKPLKRRQKIGGAGPPNLKLEWKLFLEQSIFTTLSSPRAVIESFTQQGALLDSQSLWYCMLRMTRVAPSLVFDSLWAASASLFAPPKTPAPPHTPMAKALRRNAASLSNEEAGFLLSVCFHALVAAAPLLTDFTQLMNMSRIRSHGLALSRSGAVASQPTSLCLQYEDVFSDHMALRLARRLLAAVSTRRHFDELSQLSNSSEDGVKEPNMVNVLLSHLDFSNGESQPALHFSGSERLMHEKRVPILLLDWARTVMIDEWGGRPEVAGDGAFGGALSLMEAMYQKKHSLLLADAAFRTEYFGDRLDAIQMPVNWLSFESTRQKAHLLDYPYMFHPSSLVSYFRGINFSRMSRAYEESSSLQSRVNAIVAPDSLVTESHQKNVLQDMLKVPSAKFLVLDIGRKTVIRDAFNQLWRREERELTRPLKVHLGEDTGEEGFDSGGVQQEFFRLAVAEALNPDFGAFTVDSRTRMTWFQPGSLQPDWKFELVGILLSLAVYNGLTLPITFPKAFYRRLLGEPVTELHHIADGWPDLASGLTTLVEWDEKNGAIEDVFVRTYEFSVSMFDKPISREMTASQEDEWPQFASHAYGSPSVENPEEAPLVTGDNREAYVSDYIRYLTDVSVRPQFEALSRGFGACLNTKSLRLLNSSLLQSLIEGTQEIDIAELRRATRYVGWDASHHTVREFWSVVKRFDDRLKRKLLEFVTASDRIPVGGMRNIQFVVQKNGEQGEGGHLPTAYTCYGTLLLPEYKDKEVLRERLCMALENAQGFGFA